MPYSLYITPNDRFYAIIYSIKDGMYSRCMVHT